MGYITLRRVRIWVLFLITINFVTTIAWYSCVGYLYEGTEKYSKQPLLWGDWLLILSAFLLFFAYIYSLGSRPLPGIKNKLLRTFLLLIPTGTIFGLRISFIIQEGQGESSPNQAPLGCPSMATFACIVVFAQFWVGLIAAFFVLVEIGVTFVWGPLERPPLDEEEVAGDEGRNGKEEEASADSSQSDLSTDATVQPATQITPRTRAALMERVNLARAYFR